MIIDYRYPDDVESIFSVRREIGLLVQTVMATDPCQLSFLYFLHYLHTCGGAQQLGDGHGGAQTYKIQGYSLRLLVVYFVYIIYIVSLWITML